MACILCIFMFLRRIFIYKTIYKLLLSAKLFTDYSKSHYLSKL